MDSRVQLRKAIRQKRSSLTQQEQANAAAQLLNQLTSNTNILSAQHIAIYLANDGELNTSTFIDWCWKHNKQVYLPVIHPFSKGHLLFLEYTPTTPMFKNRFGILEPKLDVRLIQLIHNIDIIFTPLVAFDNSGARLGMGGGFYDRTLQKWFEQYKENKKARPYPIGLAHNCQRVEAIPVEHWDIPIPQIITPTQNYLFK
ncbi:5-formyltetrahydrofolate cyclo-ligase [Pseudocolwellia agarivorans]|uniref:5-formyltetrahydrofolate cyclo-ligase n=1 Tax=Pseudocolwellia agarivorans TaxID=1911682 RepID=UPI000B5AD8A0|nr:5-formyltetrahydrofolate cyclo-ligase [Pseudocolwellia agarivorans]